MKSGRNFQVFFLECVLITIKRMLSIIVNPNRYKSKAAETFNQEILTLFVRPVRDKAFVDS